MLTLLRLKAHRACNFSEAGASNRILGGTLQLVPSMAHITDLKLGHCSVVMDENKLKLKSIVDLLPFFGTSDVRFEVKSDLGAEE